MYKIKKGDTVKIMGGKDRGKQGNVAQILPTMEKAVVEGINKMVKHLRPKKQNESGQRIEFDAPMDLSNLQLICPKCSKITRVGFKTLENKKKVRICKKCKQTID